MSHLQNLKETNKTETMKEKIYKQQIQEFNQKLQDSTQAIGMLKTPNS